MQSLYVAFVPGFSILTSSIHGGSQWTDLKLQIQFTSTTLVGGGCPPSCQWTNLVICIWIIFMESVFFLCVYVGGNDK